MSEPKLNDENEFQQLLDACPPDSIKHGRVVTLEPGIIQNKEYINDLIRLMYDFPETDVYYYNIYKSKMDSMLDGQHDILLETAELHYYKHPDHPRLFFKVKVNEVVQRPEWVQKLVKNGPMYVRVPLKLAHWKRRQMEIEQKIVMEKLSEVNPLELKPNFFGFGIDLLKIPTFIKSLKLNKKSK